MPDFDPALRARESYELSYARTCHARQTWQAAGQPLVQARPSGLRASRFAECDRTSSYRADGEVQQNANGGQLPGDPESGHEPELVSATRWS